MKLTESKLQQIIREELSKLTELDARVFKTIRNGLEARNVGGGIANFTNDTGRRNLVRVDFQNGESVQLRGVLSDKVKIIYNGEETTVRHDNRATVAKTIEQMVEGGAPSDYEQPIGKSMR